MNRNIFEICSSEQKYWVTQYLCPLLYKDHSAEIKSKKYNQKLNPGRLIRTQDFFVRLYSTHSVLSPKSNVPVMALTIWKSVLSTLSWLNSFFTSSSAACSFSRITASTISPSTSSHRACKSWNRFGEQNFRRTIEISLQYIWKEN